MVDNPMDVIINWSNWFDERFVRLAVGMSTKGGLKLKGYWEIPPRGNFHQDIYSAGTYQTSDIKDHIMMLNKHANYLLSNIATN